MSNSAKLAIRNDRFHAEETKEGDDRTRAQRDRDRIIYTSAFRRLAEVTQVVAGSHAHVFHNRLTHSLQVAQVGRRIAEKLLLRHKNIPEEIEGLDPDAVEAACLAHDLGHPPFGHVAEEELNSLAKDVNGFEGNAQSFRIVTKVAFRSLDYLGLNLTRATLAAVLKYPWFRGQNPAKPNKWGAYLSEADDFEFARGLLSTSHQQRSLEAELMDWADDVTYSVHDIEDFYRAGRIPLHLLSRPRPDTERRYFFDDVFKRRTGQPGIWSQCSRADLEQAFIDMIMVLFRIKEAYSGTQDQRSKLRNFTGRLIGRYINAIDLSRPATSSDPRVQIHPDSVKEVAMLKELTWTYIIGAPSLFNATARPKASCERAIQYLQ